MPPDVKNAVPRASFPTISGDPGLSIRGVQMSCRIPSAGEPP